MLTQTPDNTCPTCTLPLDPALASALGLLVCTCEEKTCSATITRDGIPHPCIGQHHTNPNETVWTTTDAGGKYWGQADE